MKLLWAYDADQHYAGVRSNWHWFRRLLLGESVSGFGVQLSLIAIPTFAIEYLNATASEVSLLNMVQWGPPLLLGIVAGQVADSFDRLRTMVIADVFAAITSLGLAYLIWVREVSLAQLYVLMCFVAISGTFYALGFAALVPRLLCGNARVKGNSHLAAARAISEALGQVVAARLIGIAAGALVVFLDGLTYVVRAILLRSIKREETQSGAERLPAAKTGDGSIRSTWKLLRREPELIKLIGAQGTLNLGGAFILGFFLLYVYDVLNLEPFHVAFMLATGNISAFLCAVTLPRFVRAEILGTVGALSLFLAVASIWLIVLAQWTYSFGALLLYQCLFSISATAFSVATTTRRQQLTPIDYQGRVASLAILFGYASLLVGGGLAVVSAPVLEIELGVVVGCMLSSAAIFWFAVPRLFTR